MASNFFPWRNPWREELRRMMEGLPSLRRPPALRRSLKEDWLFAMDLPRCAAARDVEGFLHEAGDAGWESEIDAGWIHLRRGVPSLPDGFFRGMEGMEAGCLRVLLRRHPGEADPALPLMGMMKAREQGPEAWDAACRALHQDFARRLRRHEPLPDIQMED